MSGIVLSASVRQNLLSLQSTADLLATTQNRLSTGKKVNTALDNPTNYFTAQGLDNRASDISNLLDGIGNGVQILQAANTGITSLQKLVDTAKSIANQALQTTVGYSTKSNVSTTIPGATADRPARHHDLHQRIRDQQRRSQRRGRRRSSPITGTTHARRRRRSAGRYRLNRGCRNGETCEHPVLPERTPRPTLRGRRAADGDVLIVNGKTITFKAAAAPAAAAVPSGLRRQRQYRHRRKRQLQRLSGSRRHARRRTHGDRSRQRRRKVARSPRAPPCSHGRPDAINDPGTGVLTLNSSTGADLDITGKADLLKARTDHVDRSGNVTVGLREPPATDHLGTLIQDGSTLNWTAMTITFKNAHVPAAARSRPVRASATPSTDGNGNSTVYLQTAPSPTR